MGPTPKISIFPPQPRNARPICSIYIVEQAYPSVEHKFKLEVSDKGQFNLGKVDSKPEMSYTVIHEAKANENCQN